MLQPGGRLDDFEIVRELGGGGMGAVYVAKQLSTGRLRALKTMHPQLAQDPAYIGPRTDIWALGLIAFHALTGRLRSQERAATHDLAALRNGGPVRALQWPLPAAGRFEYVHCASRAPRARCRLGSCCSDG